MLPSTTNEIIHLRKQHYNASVDRIIQVSDDLMILRVVPVNGVPPFSAGQYTTLGLGIWEPRGDGLAEETGTAGDATRVIKRAYSVSCSLQVDNGRLILPADYPYLEFYISLVRRIEPGPPMLTPRLFRLKEGDSLQCGTHFHGHYSVSRIGQNQDVLLIATGTGEAPHNALLAELLARGHRGRIVSSVCVRQKRDLAYLDDHRRLEREYTNYRYLPLTTREPENLDPQAVGYVGKRYLQDYVESGAMEKDADLILAPENTHVFLCGNPEMIGVPHHTHDPARRYPVPKGMVEVFERRGFAVDQSHEPGNIHFENYW